MAAAAPGDRHAQPPARKSFSHPCRPNGGRLLQEIEPDQIAHSLAQRQHQGADDCAALGRARHRARLRQDSPQCVRQGAGELAGARGAVFGAQGELGVYWLSGTLVIARSESEEAIQSFDFRLDCFATLAMTIQPDGISRHSGTVSWKML